jgi:2-succinyl-5-enolpyruvyl-6-hydroxy-3-cyclohexene-1-carboxylate synthase
VSAPANLNAAWARALIEELCRAGVRHAVVCPGSRSAPLALACAALPGLRLHTAIDERCGAFLALGLAKATGAPALVLGTSGTAGAHFYPALLEAEASRVPLLCLTADRPPELHGFGAPQTIDQRALFGGHVRAFVEVMIPEGTDAAFLHLRAQAARAAQAAMRMPRGPVHLNLPFREPLAPVLEPLPQLSSRARDGEAAAPSLVVREPSRAPDEAAMRRLAAEMARRGAGAIAVGPRDDQDDLGDALDELSRASGFPVFADAASGVRSSAAGRFVSHADLLLRHERLASALRPAVVLRLGGGVASKVLQQWLDTSSAFTALLPGGGALVDAAHSASICIEGDAAQACRSLAGHLRALRGADAPAERRALALRADAKAAETVAQHSEGSPLDEPRLAWSVARALPAGALLFVASSMPVRDVDAFAGALPGVRVLASRGVNGIDGMVSTAAGAALGSGRPTALLCGDLALLHDLGGLIAARRAGANLAVVVANNDGGGIFHFLPLHGLTDRFEELFATPHGLDLAHAAALASARLHRPATSSELRTALAESLGGGLHLVEVRTERRDNVAAHRAIQGRVLAALESLQWS